MTRDSIRKEIEIQKEIEGENCPSELLLKFLECITDTMQWQAFIRVEFYKYGSLSYQCHHFYYPKKELLEILKLGVDKGV